MLDRIVNLVRKEFIQISRDRVLMTFIVLAPVLQLSLLAQATSQGVRDRPLTVLDLDRGSYARRLVAALDNTDTLTISSFAPDQQSLRSALERGEAELGLVIPEGFGERLVHNGAQAYVQVISDGANNVVAGSALGAAQGAIGRYAKDIAESFGASFPAAPIDLRTTIRYNPTLNARLYTIPAQVGFILYQVTLAVAAVGLAREREVGTLEQLIIAPLRRWEIIAGKAMTPLSVGCLDFLLLLSVAVIVFEVPMRGSLGLLLILTLLFIVAETAWGLMISTVARTQQQAILFVFVQAMLDMTFSGYLVPVMNLPWLLRTVSNLVPMRHYLAVIRSIMLKGATAHELWPHVAALASLGLALAALAARNLSHSLD